RSYQEECLALQRPHTLEEVQAVTQQFEHHYNYERPHQGLSCGNRPPRTAFPRLPTLPPPAGPGQSRSLAGGKLRLVGVAHRQPPGHREHRSERL
ncbi:MAG TPA: integrase core domain-containing protein, partial [Ktedonobacteraceae bacterium]